MALRKDTHVTSLAAELKNLIVIQHAPPRVIVLTALASYGAQAVATLQHAPTWAVVLATILPWIPVLTAEIGWTYGQYPWLALFYVLLITQGAHFLEHVTQVTQIHLLALRGRQAQGIFGALNIEWVHFFWNSLVLLAVLVLLTRFRNNPWLWLTALVSGWHGLEHAYILSVYLRTGIEGTPGLLSSGGALAGGLPTARPDLHFVYNLIETTPLVIAFLYALADVRREPAGQLAKVRL
ncbi:MAG TPA: hypothetical protein VK457_08130 [Chloroflexota bacterium]|nr:hypothetical protein [Chloroflexota bacterium]